MTPQKTNRKGVIPSGWKEEQSRPGWEMAIVQVDGGPRALPGHCINQPWLTISD